MAVPTIQTSFAAGELAPSLFGHVDFAKFGIGAATMRNFFVSYRGGAYSRAGTSFVGYSKQLLNVATGSIFFGVNPSNGDTVTLNGVAWTFVTGATTGTNIHIGGTCAFTIATLSIALNASTNALVNVASYDFTGGPATCTLLITYRTPGAAGNAFTLAASAGTRSGPTLTGGSNAAPRLITFQFSLNQGLCLEFGNQYMRVISQGGFVEDLVLTITGVTLGTTTTLIVASTAGVSVGDWVVIASIVGTTQLNGRTAVVSSIPAPGSITITDVFGRNIDSSAYTAWSSGGTASRIYTLVTPYAVDDLKFLKFTQSADVMSLTLRNQETGTEYAPYELTRLADDNWTLAALNTAASINPPSSISGTATVTGVTSTGIDGITDYQYVVTAVDSTTGEESVASAIADIPDSVNISITAGSLVVNWSAVTGAAYYNVYKAPPAFLDTVPIGSLFGYAGTTYGNKFVDNNVVQDMTQVPPIHRNPFARGQLLSVTMTYPGTAIAPADFGYTINTATGSGAVGYGVIVDGEVRAFLFTNGGQNYALTDTITFTVAGSVQATGNIFFAANPSNGDTATFNGVVYTFVTGSGGGTNIHIQGTCAFTILNLQVALSASADPLLTVATYAQSGGPGTAFLNVTYKTGGTVGNAYTLAASVATPSNPTLTGGAGGAVPTGTLVVGPESGTYPSVVGYFQQRRAYANTANHPDTYFMSQPGQFTNFDTRVPTIDSDAITGAPWSVQVDGIQFMVPVLGGLIMLTGQAAYQVMGSGGSPTSPVAITPSSQEALPQVYNGCHFHVAPVKIDYDIVYLQSLGSVIRSLSYNFFINVFTGVDITFLSSHLFIGQNIEAMSYCEEPFKVLWAVRSDETLLSCTILKSQEVMAWARHDTNGGILGCTSVIEPPVDALYLVTQRFFPDGDAPFMIERMNDRLWNSRYDAWCVDAALQLPHTHPTVALTMSSANGLGQPVSAVIDDGGSGYASTVTVDISDPTGTGCTATATVASGVITAINFSGGTGYTKPTLSVRDTGRTGKGFAGRVVLNNACTFTSAGSAFNSGMVGWRIRNSNMLAQITHFTDSQTVTAQVISPNTGLIPNSGGVIPQIPAGAWTLDNPTSSITGLFHLAGLEVTGNADGNVITPRTVGADGTITLDEPATNVIVGLGFQTQLQSLYLIGDSPTEQGRRKQIPAVTVRVEFSGSFKAGTNQPDGSTFLPQILETEWDGMQDAPISGPGLNTPAYGSAEIQGVTMTRCTPLYTGDVRVTVRDGFDKKGQVAVQGDDPMPLQVLAFIREVVEGDTPETEPKQGKGQQQ